MPPSHADDDDDLPAMIASVRALLGDPDSWDAPGGYDSVGLAMIDAIWSIGVRYQSVENVIARYRAERLAGGHPAEADGPREVRRFIEASGGPEGFALRMRNHQRTSSRNGILKAEAVLREARILEHEASPCPPISALPARSVWITCEPGGRRCPVRRPASPGGPSACSSVSPRSSPTA